MEFISNLVGLWRIRYSDFEFRLSLSVAGSQFFAYGCDVGRSCPPAAADDVHADRMYFCHYHLLKLCDYSLNMFDKCLCLFEPAGNIFGFEADKVCVVALETAVKKNIKVP